MRKTNRAVTTLARFQNEDKGSFTVFGLFIFMMILLVSGVAVDMMRYERERVAVQNTLDTAVVAATRLNQKANTDAEVTALVKSYFEKAGYDPGIVQVDPQIEKPTGSSEETQRSIKALVDFTWETTFMNWVGIGRLPGIAGGGAREGQQLIEVALVLDISGSMGWGSKLDDMQDAAKSFVEMLINNNGKDRVMISIVPYNAQVQISEDLVERLSNNIPDRTKWIDALRTIDPAPTHPGAVATYKTHNPNARCATFLDADFDTMSLAADGELNPSGKFSHRNHNYNRPGDWSYWCGEGYPEMLLYQNDINKINSYIDSLTANGWTAIDYGMKWGVGVLDPDFRPFIQDMLADSKNKRATAQQTADETGNPYVPPSEYWLVPDSVQGHPVDYATPNVFKYVVLMTDGANTNHIDLKEEFKYGPSRVWYSDELGEDNFWEGFLVEMPNNGSNSRWYQPKQPWGNWDDEYLSEADFAALDTSEVDQWTYHGIYERFSVPDAARYFFRYSDWNAYVAHANAWEDVGGFDEADTNLARICDESQKNGWIEVFTVAFEAPRGGVEALERCSQLNPGNFYITAGDQLTAAFEAIAAEITKLRLTQ